MVATPAPPEKTQVYKLEEIEAAMKKHAVSTDGFMISLDWTCVMSELTAPKWQPQEGEVVYDIDEGRYLLFHIMEDGGNFQSLNGKFLICGLLEGRETQ